MTKLKTGSLKSYVRVYSLFIFPSQLKWSLCLPPSRWQFSSFNLQITRPESGLNYSLWCSPLINNNSIVCTSLDEQDKSCLIYLAILFFLIWRTKFFWAWPLFVSISLVLPRDYVREYLWSIRKYWYMWQEACRDTEHTTSLAKKNGFEKVVVSVRHCDSKLCIN